MNWIMLFTVLLSGHTSAGRFPERHVELLPYVQAAPDQGETNTCWFVASTGAMELLLNQQDQIKDPQVGGKNDLSESFLIWQRDWRGQRTRHFIEEVVIRFNHGEAVHDKLWPFRAYNSDGTDSLAAWNRHAKFESLERMKVPQVETELLFSRGKKYATYVLTPKDIQKVKEALVTNNSPVLINYNDDGYWHVVLIVGFDDKKLGSCYDVDPSECNEMGTFYVRDSNGTRYEARAYDWFLIKGNAAAVVKLKRP